MKDQDRERRSRRREGGWLPPLMRALGPSCNFCGASAIAVAVLAKGRGQQVAICSSCIGAAAAGRLTPGGGDAA